MTADGEEPVVDAKQDEGMEAKEEGAAKKAEESVAPSTPQDR